MQAATDLDANFATSVTASLVVLLLCLAGGAPLTPRCLRRGGCDLTSLAFMLASGLVFWSGIAAAVTMRGAGFWLAMPVIQATLAALLWRREAVVCPPARTGRRRAVRLVAPVLVMVAVCVLFIRWWAAFRSPDGRVVDVHSDLGYYGQLVLGMKESGHASLWSGVLGSAVVESGAPFDVWYHWGPVWLASGVHEFAGLSVMESLLQADRIVLTVLLAIAAGAIVETLTGWSPGWSLLVGGISVIAVPLLKMFGILWFAGVLPYGILQHHSTSLVIQLSYHVEALLVLVALAAWLSSEDLPAGAMLFFAGVSAPHALAAAGVMAGALLTAGLLRRDRVMWKTALAVISILLAAWAMLSFVLGVNLPKSPESRMLTVGFNAIRLALRAGLVDTLISIVAGALMVPGVVHLMRLKDEGVQAERPRILGWMALCALAGGFAAYHLFSSMADRFHFSAFTRIVLIVPTAIWGMARMASRTAGPRKAASIALIILGGLMGVSDLVQYKNQTSFAKWSATDLGVIKKALGSEPFGYFAASDRNWWIPEHCTLASFLNVRCVRLNFIKSTDAAGQNGIFYGSSKPRELVPLLEGESEDQWSLRFARKLGIKRILEVEKEPLPDAISRSARKIAASGPLRVYELPAAIQK
ncbi:MAG: hypothetical protein K1X78_07620 [Verrucomicrobiaceae bacterium]|nr:hypothetical protein [Verrucomicrobiaceae bacterium]